MLSCLILAFVFGCKNENQSEKTQEQPQPVEKQETSKKEEKTTGINKRDRLGRTKLHIAAKYAKNLEAVTTLIQAGADVNVKDKYGKTPLHFAAQSSNNPKIVTILIKAGANVDARDQNGKTSLFFVRDNNITVILIQAGADVKCTWN